jgi:hypothetical protein
MEGGQKSCGSAISMILFWVIGPSVYWTAGCEQSAVSIQSRPDRQSQSHLMGMPNPA